MHSLAWHPAIGRLRVLPCLIRSLIRIQAHTDRVDSAGVCAAMPTGVITNVKDLEGKGFGFIKPDNGEASSRRMRARPRPLSAQLRSVCAFFSTTVSPPRPAPVRARMSLPAIAPNPPER